MKPRIVTIRLDCSNQPINTNFDVGQVWELDYYLSPQVTPPHVEDIIVARERYICTAPIRLDTKCVVVSSYRADLIAPVSIGFQTRLE
jgi:hypothetical protein